MLIYLLLADRDVEIVADRGVHTEVGSHEGEALCRALQASFKRGNYAAGVVHGIRAVTELLVRHFPASGYSARQLPDRPVIL